MTDAPLTAEERAELLALCERATPGEWRAFQRFIEDADDCPLADCLGEDVEAADNAAFIAAARAGLPRALRDLERAEAELDLVAAFLATYGKTKDDVVGALAWIAKGQDEARAESENLRGLVRDLTATVERHQRFLAALDAGLTLNGLSPTDAYKRCVALEKENDDV